MDQIDVVFKQGDRVGAAAAEVDNVLQDAFVDTGVIDILRDTSNPKSLVVGRTGCGKSALLLRLKKLVQGRVLELDPASLALGQIESSNLPSMVDSGVVLDPFFRFLWRHVIVMAILSRWREGKGERSWDGIWSKVLPRGMRTAAMRRRESALAELREWNEDLDAPAELRTERIISHFVARLGAEVKLPGLGVKLPGVEYSRERTQSAPIQAAVNKLSSSRAASMKEFLQEEVLTDAQKPFYILIDQLDKRWVDARFAFDLLDALIAVVGEFAELPNVKVIVALRENILSALHYREERTQQREKHEDLILRLEWTEEQLREIADKRLKALLRDRYHSAVTLHTFLPPPRGKTHEVATEYVLARTYDRPRDLIDFVNLCLGELVSRSARKMSWEILQAAAREHSAARLRAIEDEWKDNYPRLKSILDSLRGVETSFTAADLGGDRLTDVLADGERLSDGIFSGPVPLPLIAYRMLDDGAEYDEIWFALLAILYRVGAVGVKRNAQEPIRYYYQRGSPSGASLPRDARYYIHPALQLELGVNVYDPSRGDTV